MPWSGGSSSRKPTRRSASAQRQTRRPSPPAFERSCAAGSVSTRSTVAPLDVEEAQDRRARLRHGERRRPAATTAAASATHRHGNGLPAARAATTSSGSGGNASSRPSCLQALLERAHASASRLSRRRARARARRDLTVPRRIPERGRGLLLGELEQVAAGDRVAVVVGQPLDRREQPLLVLARDERRLGGRDRVPRAGLVDRAQDEPLAAARRAAAVASLVGDDPQQPRLERRAAPEAPERALRLDESVLRGLLGVGGVARQQVRRAERDPLICAHERLPGLEVAAPGPLDELGFVQWPVHHRRVIHRRGTLGFRTMLARVARYEVQSDRSTRRLRRSARRRSRSSSSMASPAGTSSSTRKTGGR